MRQIYSNRFKIFSNLFILFLVLLHTSTGSIFAQSPVVSNFSNFSYTERTSPVYAAPSVTVTGGLSYNTGYVRFSIPGAAGDETLALTSAADPTAYNAISTDGSSVYLGQGGSSKIRIGEIDATENGQNGQPLKVLITFERSFPNASFEDGIGGWTVYNQLYSSQMNLNGMELPIRPGENCGYAFGLVKIDGSPRNTTFNVQQTTLQSPTDGSNCIMLSNNGTVVGAPGATCRSAAYSIFGPSIISNAFNSYNGDKFSVDWKAIGGSDWYDVIGYLLGYGNDHTWNTGDDTRVVMFSERGSARPSWATSQITITTDGEYKFEFVSGSYDRSGGTVLGATLYVDNLQLVSGAMVGISDANMQEIARQITYQNSSCEPPSTQPVTITVLNTAGNTGSQSAAVSITEVNCAPLMATIALNPSFVENSAALPVFSSTSITNIETGQSVTDLTMTVSGIADGSSEEITIDGSTFALVDGESGVTTTHSIDYNVSVSGSVATINLSKAPGISETDMESVVNTVEYRNTIGNPTGGTRTIALTYLKDDGGTANGGSDQSVLTEQSVVTVKPAAKMAISSGDNQVQKVTTTLNSFSVLVTTADDMPVSGRTVSFEITTVPSGSTGESISTLTTTTDSQGKASTVLTLGIKTGNYIVSATCAGLSGSPVALSATATPGTTDANTSELTVDNSTVIAGNSAKITITPRDIYNNPGGAGLTVVVKLDGSTSDDLGPITVTDNNDGTYTANVTITNIGDNNIISATVDNLPLTATTAITLNPAQAHHFVVSGIQTPHIYGVSQDIDIVAQDEFGNVTTDYTGTVTFSSSDIDATLPADYTFIPADAGQKTITGALLFGKAGNFSLTVSEDGNPSVTGSQTGIVVNKKMLTITAEDTSRVYSASDPAFTFSYSGFLTGEDETLLQTRPVASSTVLQNSGAGVYTDAITLAGGADPRYDFTYIPADFTVTKAMLTVTADAKTKIYGEENPALTLQYSGFVPGEDESVLDTKPAAATSITADSNSGVYSDDITVAGAADVNYDFTYCPGRLHSRKGDTDRHGRQPAESLRIG